MKSLLFICFTFFISNCAVAQSSDIKTQADIAFSEKRYFDAAFYYQKLVEGTKGLKEDIPFYSGNTVTHKKLKADRPYNCYQLAESYRLCRNYHDAETWYSECVTQHYDQAFPLTRLWYGVCLRANQNFDLAIKQLLLFNDNFKGDSKFKVLAGRELATSIFARQLYSQSAAVDVKKMDTKWNSDGGNYGLTKNNGDIWFTASRYDARQKKYLNNIYKTDAQNTPGTAFVKPGVAKTGTYTEYGTPSLTQSGKRIYFTAWRKNGNKINLAIYYGQFANNRWTTLVKLNSNVNTNGYNALQPFVTGDGKRLFFASDKPGGLGGMDLWVSNLNDDGNALDATNLGDKINSSEDEAAPFYDAGNNKLIYSSKGFTGLGGFDFFESCNNKGQWGVPVNLGYPLNSSKDDLYYFQDPADNYRSYISSDRESDCCLNLFEVNYKQLFINGKILSCDSGKVMQGVKISLLDTANNQVLNTVETSATGSYLFKTDNKKGYRLRIEKEGYFSKVIKGSDTLFNQLTCLQQYQVNKPIRIKNILYDFDRATLRPESKTDLDSLVKILADNPRFEIELASHTDSIGSDVYNLNLSQLRAQECVNYIISKGISKDRLYAKGYGKNRPIAPNTFPDGTDNPYGRQLNRRTEFTVVKR